MRGFLVQLRNLSFGFFDIGLRDKAHGQDSNTRESSHTKRNAQSMQQVVMHKNLPSWVAGKAGRRGRRT